MPRKLTDSYVRGLRLAPGEKPRVVRDAAVTGLMVKVNKDSASYAIQRELWLGTRGARRLAKTCRITLGDVTELKLEDARARAMELLAMIKRGVDPSRPAAPRAGELTVAELFRQYADDMAQRDCAPRSVADVLWTLDNRFADWKRLPLSAVRRGDARERHAAITSGSGRRAANLALRIYGAAFNFALKVVDDPDALGVNPVGAVTFHRERASNKVIAAEELPTWWQKLQGCAPLRREMHTLGLLSGLRPGNLVAIRREWVKLDARAISFPKLKSGRSFDLPLSGPMVACIQRALAIGDALYPSSPHLFPTRSSKTGDVIATPTWKQKELPSQTGHILRHTWRTHAQRIGVDTTDAMLLLDHRVGGISGVYVHAGALFARLLRVQERMSRSLLDACGAAKVDGAKAKNRSAPLAKKARRR